MHFIIFLDKLAGVAVGTEYCNAESPAITDHSVWKFTIGMH